MFFVSTTLPLTKDPFKVHYFTLFHISILVNSFIIVIFAVTKTDVLFIQNK